MKKIVYSVLLSLLLSGSTWAEQAFVVRNIRFQGLQLIQPATVESYLPIKRGETLQPAKTAAILRALYQTGFFDRITLAREDGTLIINVVERPTIGQLKITGNSVIPTDKLTTVMKTMDVSEGRVYNRAVLEKIKQSLLNQYYQLGRYNARVDITSSSMSRNRVLVKINISEGLVAKIRSISIIGNHAFEESKLVKQLEVNTTGLFSFFTQSDRYSEERLEASLEKLRGYYMDHGYLRMEVKSAQAEVTPDRKAVFINMVIEEGQPYTVKDYMIEGHLILPREEVLKHITIKPGETFSRQKVLDSEKAISEYYGSKGYMFSTVSLKPQIDDKNRQITLVFTVKPGKRAYVRHITFSDNSRTNDVVLRREMQQLEGAPVSTTKLESSKNRLLLLPFIKEADMSVKPVSGTDDQVDVNYKVKEDNSAQASFKVGYSQVYRTILGAGLNQKNFFGTGNTLGINLSRSKYEQFYGIDFTNPYYTEDGISRTFSFAVSRVDPRGAGVNNGYTTHEYDAGVLYGIPLGFEENAINRAQVGLGYQNTLVNLINDKNKISNQILSFVHEYGRRFQELDIKLGISRDSRDKAIFATKGSIQTLFFDGYAPISSNSITFYTFNYHGKVFQPLTEQFILTGRADLGYGNGRRGAREFPFFKNYYAGGIDSVRGYQGFTLGPRDSKDKPFGANMLADASIGLIFPNYLTDNLRTSVFFDAGNVYSSTNNKDFGGASTNSGPIRYSFGVEADWITPFGPIALSLAQPVNLRKHDQRETFQFALGANF